MTNPIASQESETNSETPTNVQKTNSTVSSSGHDSPFLLFIEKARWKEFHRAD